MSGDIRSTVSSGIPSDRFSDRADGMRQVLANQRNAHRAEGTFSARRRIDLIDRAIALLRGNARAIAQTLREDFGHRSIDGSLLTDIAGTIEPLRYARESVREWMKPERRRVTPSLLGILGARARVEYQPKGVVGVIAPWNFPIVLSFAPLAGIFAAGNRVMIKPSEFTPATSELMARMVRSAYDETEAAVVTGGPEVAEAFCGLPFDHILFTGGGAIARRVLCAAAANLVPVTLELGGKSPVIVGDSADLDLTAKRVMAGKMLNAGQICVAPDYVLVPKARERDFVNAAVHALRVMFPTLKENPDYTSIINRRHSDRLHDYIADARAKGAEVIELNPAAEDFSRQLFHKVPPALILHPTDDMTVMEEEIFGPLLPVKAYSTIDEAIEYVNARPRPLCLYYFGRDARERRQVLSRTVSGGAAVNDVVIQVMMTDLPFGGVGPSGMGTYNGIEGFRTFSHVRSVFEQSRWDLLSATRPPYGPFIRKWIDRRIWKYKRANAQTHTQGAP